jgi:hypothetical protein
MNSNLETLELLPEEREVARNRIRAIAYQLWTDAGSPGGESLIYWLQAERTWMEHEYVPHRNDK